VTAPIGEPPLDALPPDAAATVEDVRASRRWTWVALAWAIAASAIAVIALVQNSNDNSSDNQPAQTTQQTVSPNQLKDFQSQVNDRLDAFSRRLNNTAAQGDVQKLDKRVAQAEDDASKAQDGSSKQADTITQQQADIKDLQKRVDDLESQQQNQQTTP
jgi:tetrahydromethanopterin S-methyltransferase subunit G